MKIGFAQLSIDAYEELLCLWNDAPGVGSSTPTTRAALAGFLDRNPGLSFGARCGVELAGAVLCGHDGRRGYLHHLAVARPFRRRGIAHELTRLAVEGLRRIGIQKCHLLVQRSNEDGLRFWKAAGWIEREELAVMSTFAE